MTALDVNWLSAGSAKRWWVENAAEMRPAPNSGQWMLLDKNSSSNNDGAEELEVLYAPRLGERTPADSEVEIAVLGGEKIRLNMTETF